MIAYWGWRPLVFCLFISVWITGCTDSHDATPQPNSTNLPHPTLSVRIPQPTYTPIPPNLPPITTLLPLYTSYPTIEKSPLLISPPSCYESFDGGVLCLGSIINDEGQALENITLIVHILGQENRLLASQIITVEQRIIPVGGTAPYRAMFTAEAYDLLADNFQGAAVSILRGMWRSTQESSDVLPEVENHHGETISGRYRVTVELHNPTPKDQQNIRLVITLLDAEERVTGYRVVDIERITAQAHTTIMIEIIPQVEVTHYRIHVEGRTTVDPPSTN